MADDNCRPTFIWSTDKFYPSTADNSISTIILFYNIFFLVPTFLHL